MSPAVDARVARADIADQGSNNDVTLLGHPFVWHSALCVFYSRPACPVQNVPG